ncbi:2-keto-4-pentenoate hydratase [Fredinandcohnia humi]
MIDYRGIASYLLEAEIAFILSEDIEGPITGEQVLSKTKWILPALEIIDSRYENFAFALLDVIADNTYASRVVFGEKLYSPNEFDLESIEVSMFFNGQKRVSGVSSEVLGNPENSVAMLANMLCMNKQQKLNKNTIILTGGITEAVLLQKGDHVVTEYAGMNQVSFRIK